MAALCISNSHSALNPEPPPPLHEDRFEISVQQVMSCNSQELGCDGGYAAAAADAFQQGIVKERDAEYACGGGDPLLHCEVDAGGSCEHTPWGSECAAASLAVPGWNVDSASRVDGEAD